MNDIPKPDVGRLTFDAEGQEGGIYHSRRLHVPSAASGLTIGRGYDMKHRTKTEIRDDLIDAGVASADAALISQAATLTGDTAEEFIAENDLEAFEISPDAQLQLFEVVYEELAADARRLATKADVTQVYGATDWPALDPTIKDTLIDLRFRGDYTPTSRRFLQVHVANNDLPNFAAEIGERENWPNVPADRYNRRRAFVEEALARTAIA